MRSSVRQALALAAVSGLLFFIALGSVDLWDEDEPIFAGAAREMLARQEWIVPYFNGQMLPDKPVLSYWVMIVGYKLFGETEFAARAGSALFSMGTVLFTWLVGRRMFSPRAGVWAGLMLASSFSFLIVSRAATPDAVLTFFGTLAMLCFVWSLGADWPQPNDPNTRLVLPASGSRLALAGSYAAMGMAVLAKGPIGVLLPMATIALYWLLISPHSHLRRREVKPPRRWLGQKLAELRLKIAHLRNQPAMPRWLRYSRGIAASTHSRNTDSLGAALPQPPVFRQLSSAASRFRPGCLLAAMKSMHPLLAIAIVLTVAGPWYLAVGLSTEGAWLSGFFGKHNLQRFLHPMEHHRGPLYYYPLAVVIGFFPWSLFLGPAALFVGSRLRAASRDRSAYCLLLCWIGVYIAFFSMAATKLPNYIVPVYPALALLIGAWLDAWLAGTCVVRPILLRTAWAMLAVVGLAASIALPLAVYHYFGDGMALGVIGVPLIVGGLLCWGWHARQQPGHAVMAFAISAIVFWLALFGFGSVQVGRYQTSRQFAEAIRRHSFGAAPAVRTFRYWRPSLVYYLGQHVEQLSNDEQVRSFCRHWPREGFLLIPGDAYARVADDLPHDVAIIERGAWFLKKKELLLLGRGSVETPLGAVAWRTSSPH